ncbi:hypothetical protein BSL78_08952 [Apostichopus japonicus]|uniref:Uncharacterized protein n=1 Tax=Stichopus japonicus TaxID=307972 RepID=A0A2G8L1N6_STIJA|nr:hypothetical protein BSL78_08952 [Apostichopus japonicus]
MAPQPAPDPDALDCRASVNLSGLEDEGEPIDPDPLDYDPMEDSFGHNYEPEEAPVTGGALPQELITRAADIFRRHLGFEEPETQPQKAGRVSKLTATGEASYKPKTTIPVDATCYDRFEAIANKTKWTAFPARADRAVRVPDEAWKDLFQMPNHSPGGQGEIKSRTRGLIHTRVQDPGPEEARRAFGRGGHGSPFGHEVRIGTNAISRSPYATPPTAP